MSLCKTKNPSPQNGTKGIHILAWFHPCSMLRHTSMAARVGILVGLITEPPGVTYSLALWVMRLAGGFRRAFVVGKLAAMLPLSGTQWAGYSSWSLPVAYSFVGLVDIIATLQRAVKGRAKGSHVGLLTEAPLQGKAWEQISTPTLKNGLIVWLMPQPDPFFVASYKLPFQYHSQAVIIKL